MTASCYPIQTNEYEYLRDLIYCRYESEFQNSVQAIASLHKEAVKDGDYDRAILLNENFFSAREALLQRCLRLERIVAWLEIDNDLRKENLTYPDILELCSNQ